MLSHWKERRLNNRPVLQSENSACAIWVMYFHYLTMLLTHHYNDKDNDDIFDEIMLQMHELPRGRNKRTELDL